MIKENQNNSITSHLEDGNDNQNKTIYPWMWRKENDILGDDFFTELFPYDGHDNKEREIY